MTPGRFIDYRGDPELATCFANEYIRQYYNDQRSVTTDEAAVYRFIRRVRHRLPADAEAIDVGCGPTVHHAIMLAPFVGRIDLADYLETNLTVVRSWLRGSDDSDIWSEYSAFCEAVDREDGIEATGASRIALTRARIRNVFGMNLLNDDAMAVADGKYDLVCAFYCIEEIALERGYWGHLMRRLHSFLKPGGALLLSCLHDSSFYALKRADGSVRRLPCYRVTEPVLREVLAELGFREDECVVEVFDTPGQLEEGVAGVVLAMARKVISPGTLGNEPSR